MIVNCADSTVDFTTRKLSKNKKFDEITEARSYHYGGSFVDEEFIKFLSSKVGSSAIKILREKHYSRLQYIVQELCRRVKFKFTGQKDKTKEDFVQISLDLEGDQ